MIQPQVVILFVVFVLVWVGSHRKWGMIAWFAGTLLILGIVAALLVPDWPIQYLRILWNYRDYFAPGTPGYAFSNWWPGLGRQMGWVLGAVVGLVLLVEWWLSLRRDYRWFLWTACLTMTVSLWIGIPVNPDAHVMLNLPLLLILSMFAQRWRRGGIWVAITGVVAVFVWEWGLIYATLGEVDPAMRLGLIFPLPLILLIGLFWVRWWTIHPKRLLIDELRSSETY